MGSDIDDDASAAGVDSKSMERKIQGSASQAAADAVGRAKVAVDSGTADDISTALQEITGPRRRAAQLQGTPPAGVPTFESYPVAQRWR